MMSLPIIDTILGDGKKYLDLIDLARRVVNAVVAGNAEKLVFPASGGVDIHSECDQLRRMMLGHGLETFGFEDDIVFYNSFVNPLIEGVDKKGGQF